MFIHLKARSNRTGGFTLLEVLAAMALITFVIGGVYGISGSAVELGRSMSEARIVDTRVTNFVAVWRDYFAAGHSLLSGSGEGGAWWLGSASD
jgi:prepilin-type N-terminal cleavage/methylation domain-containing protein